MTRIHWNKLYTKLNFALAVSFNVLIIKFKFIENEPAPEKFVIILGCELLPSSMNNIALNTSIFVVKGNVYFVYETGVDKYITKYN